MKIYITLLIYLLQKTALFILISNQKKNMHKPSKCITYKVWMGEMFDLHTLEPCRGTLEQGIKPTTVHIGLCDGLVPHPGLDAAFAQCAPSP